MTAVKEAFLFSLWHLWLHVALICLCNCIGNGLSKKLAACINGFRIAAKVNIISAGPKFRVINGCLMPVGNIDIVVLLGKL